MLRVQPSRHSKPIMNSLGEELGRLPADARRTATFDRGTEFAAYPALKTSLGMDAYFCAPQAPWQKGTVENTNGRLRRFLPLDRAHPPTGSLPSLHFAWNPHDGRFSDGADPALSTSGCRESAASRTRLRP
ncbi:IS30 family transposase [Phenylobacterium sp. LjRoot219]|uniref:IS30 family transposase n=1 Tax=Phenylobacterium sp. LjRoot219 TaxID=3342283 RepID=UPI003F4F450D